MLKLDVADKFPDPFPWDTITLLKKDLNQPEDLIKGWLLSEVEVRTSNPGQLERLLSWTYLAWESGVQLPKTLAGLFSYALVDKVLLENEPSIYPKFFRYKLEYLKSAGDPLTRFFFNVSKFLLGDRDKGSEKKVAEVYEILFERSLGSESKLKLMLDNLPKEIAAHKEDKILQGPLTYGSISENTPPYAISARETDGILRTLVSAGATPTKLKLFLESAHLCLKSSFEYEDETKRFDEFLKENIEQLRALARYSERKMLDKAKMSDEIVSKFMSRLKEQHIPVNVGDRIKYRKFLQDVLDTLGQEHTLLTARERRYLIRNMTKLYLSNVFIEVAMELRGFRKQYVPPPMGTWNMGEPIKALSLVDTFRIYGLFIPGVFAMKRFELWQKREFANICVLMDVSGSTAIGNKLEYMREAVFCLIEACRFMSDRVSFIPFSSKVDDELLKMHTKDYETIEDIIVSLEPSGYTNILPPLLLALKAATDIAFQNTYIFTDGGIWDGVDARGVIAQLAKHGKIFIFLVGDKLDYLDDDVKGLANVATVHECNTRQSLLESSLQEYFNK